MMFWLFAGLLALAVFLVLLLPLLYGARSSVSRAEYDINVYKDQLIELEKDAADGRIGESELAAARLEIQRRLLTADEEASTSTPKKSKGGSLPIIIAAVAVPVLSFAFYNETGSPDIPNFPLAERTDIQITNENTAQAPMTELARSLEDRLLENPDDARGWALLGRTYATIGDPRKAAAAFQKAVPLSNRHPEVLADWAEARLMARSGEFTTEIFADFIEAREKDPTLPKPWFYIGLDKAMGDDFEGAAQIWTDLLAIVPDNALFSNAVREQIARAAEQGGFDASDLKPSETAKKIAQGMESSLPENSSASSALVAPGPTQEQMKAAGEMSPEDRMAFIQSMVNRLAEKLEENPNDRTGWERLIRAYEVLGDTEKAEAAKARLEVLPIN